MKCGCCVIFIDNYMYMYMYTCCRMWAASSQHFNALLQLDPNNTQARIHRARAQYKLVSTLILYTCMYM